MTGRTIYIIDSSSLIDAWNELYPMENFPVFWKRMEDLVAARRLFAPSEVVSEIGRKADDSLAKWAKSMDGFEVAIDAQQQIAVKAVLKSHPTLVDTMKGRGNGDPWVIALAKSYSGCVVTQERNHGTQQRPRIPMASHSMGVACTNLIGMIRAEKWRVG